MDNAYISEFLKVFFLPSDSFIPNKCEVEELLKSPLFNMVEV